MDEKKYSERELVLAQRKAFVAGVCRWPDATSETPIASIAKDAAVIFPLPKVERPRVARDPDKTVFEFRAMDGRIQERRTDVSDSWTNAQGFQVTATRCAVWSDLLANPVELIEDPG